MRVNFVQAVGEVLSDDPRATLVTGDLGFAAFEEISSKYSRRFLNAGVAEQNMVGVAAGMALTGLKPWVYSIAPFVTYRCLEQIRNDLCLHRLPVRLAGNGGGYTYGIMGSTHHALEDLAVLRPLPNMQLFFPCQNDHVAAAVRAMAALDGPAYLRLAISGYASDRAFLGENSETLTRRYAVREDPKRPNVTVIGVGHAVQIALQALERHQLSSHNVDVFGVARFPWNLASDQELVSSVASSGSVVVIEEHYRDGGMAESLRSALPNVHRFVVLAAAYSLDQRFGSARFHLEQTGLTPEALTNAVRAMLAGNDVP